MVSFIDRLGTSSAADYVYPPSNVKELAWADLILRGSVLEIVDDGVKLFATAEPTPEEEDAWFDEEEIPYIDQSAPMIRVDVRVDELIFAQPPIVLEPGSVVSLSFWGRIDEYPVPTPSPWFMRDWPEVWRRMRIFAILPQVGDDRLFLLGDQGYWSPAVADYFGLVHGAYSILDLSGPQVMLNSSPPIPIDITENTTPEAFLEELKAALREQ